MKFLSLVWKSTVLLFRRNRAAFVIFLAVQTVVSLGFVFFFTTTFTARENYMRSRENMRTVEVDLSEPAAGSSVAGLPDKLAKNPAVSLSNIQFTFILNSEKGKERPRQFIAYRNPDEYKSRIVGAGITQRQITEKSPVIVSGNMDRMMDPKSVWHQAGDTEELDGLKLKVIGTYQTTDNYGEIPYTVGLRHFALKSMKLQVPAGATDNQKEALGQYAESLIPGCRVKVPVPLTQKVLGNMLFPYLAGLLIGVSALANLLFIFKYMLESSRQDYFVYQVCGCGRKKMAAVLSCELFSLFTLCFAAGTLLLAGLRQAYRTNSVFAGSSLQAPQVLLVYAVSLLVIALIMTPYLLRYRGRAVNSGGEL
jgi:hypothetical protein